MGSHRFTWTDDAMLTALHLRDDKGMTQAQVAAAVGCSHASLNMMFHRVRADEQPCTCTKPENRNGAWQRERREVAHG